MKKTVFFFLLFTLSKLVVCQEENKKGTITVGKPIVLNTEPCSATILGYTGQNNVVRDSLFGLKKIELNAGCNCKIVSYQFAYMSNDQTIRMEAVSELIPPNIVSAIRNTGFVKFEKIVIQDIESGSEKILPPIIFIIE